MNNVKNILTGTAPRGVDADKFNTLKQAFNNGQLTFTRTNHFKNNVAPFGYIIYEAKYTVNGKVVYSGAFQISLDIERELINKNELYVFLAMQLTNEI